MRSINNFKGAEKRTLFSVNIGFFFSEMREFNKHFQGNMRYVFQGAKLFISNTRCRLQPSAQTSYTHLECACSLCAGSNNQFCPVKNMPHITMTGFIEFGFHRQFGTLFKFKFYLKPFIIMFQSIT